MSNKPNIEDVFRKGFDDFQMKPSGKVWDGINKQMAGPRLESSYKNAFDGFRINPSEQIWRRVAAAIWFQKFIHFSPFSFNIYYLATVITVIVGSVAVINNNPNLDFVDFDQTQYMAKKTDSLAIEQSELNYFDKFVNGSLVENQISENVENQNTNSVTQINNLESGNSEDLINENNYSINNQKVVTTNSTVKISTGSQDEELNLNNNKDIAGSSIENIKAETILNTGNVDKSEVLVGFNNSETKNEIKIDKELKLSKIFIKNNKLLTYKPQWYDNADKVITGLPEYEVIVKDTIGYNYQGEPVVVDKSWLEAGLYFSPYLFDAKSKTLNQELLPNNLMFNKGVKPELSWSAGLYLSYNYNRFRIESGLLFGSQSESFSQIAKGYDTLTIYSYNYFENTSWGYDTTMILDLDEYLQGNIVYIPYIDSTQFYFTDSLLVSHQDSALVDKMLTGASKITYLGVPLIGGYEFAYGKFVFTPKAGVVFGLLQNQNGTGYRISDGRIVEIPALNLNKYTISYYGALNLQYRTGEHFGLFAEPYISGSLISEYRKSVPVDRRSTKYGLRLGISYRF